jgi:hypothetical protein
MNSWRCKPERLEPGVVGAHQLAIREQLSWFDALIAEAAIRCRCARLFSEDFSHGRWIAAVEMFIPCADPQACRWIPEGSRQPPACSVPSSGSRAQGACAPARRRRCCIGKRAVASKRPIGQLQPMVSPASVHCLPPPAIQWLRI